LQTEGLDNLDYDISEILEGNLEDNWFQDEKEKETLTITEMDNVCRAF
jgi:hypothetical protein